MVRIESWKVSYKLKLLDVCLFVAYPGKKITKSTTPSDRTEFDILTVTDQAGNMIYDGTTEPYQEVPDDLMNAVVFDNFFNSPQSVLVFSSIPEDDHIDADHEIIVKQPIPDEDSDSEDYSDYSSEEEDDDEDEDDDPDYGDRSPFP